MTDYFGYVAALDREEGVPRVCCLVVDERGRPQEFVYSDPQEPSGMQRALWGSALSAELERTATLAAVEKLTLKPIAFFVSKDSLFETLRDSKHERSVAQLAVDGAGAKGAKKSPFARLHPDDTFKQQLEKGDVKMSFELHEPLGRIAAVGAELKE